MRRLFGLASNKDKDTKAKLKASSSHTTSPTTQSTAAPSPSSSSSPRLPDSHTPTTGPAGQAAGRDHPEEAGLGIDFDTPASRRSRHVQFSSTPSLVPPANTTSTEQQGQRHSLQLQSSFESRHGQPSAYTTNCFPSSGSSPPPPPIPNPSSPKPRDPSSSSSVATLHHMLERTTSPLSYLSGSVTTAGNHTSPYGGALANNPSLAKLADRDPSLIYSPLTWSELANQELVDNLGARERTRQEVLWEVVSSEERYVTELRSLVNHYVNPLLHPHLNSLSHQHPNQSTATLAATHSPQDYDASHSSPEPDHSSPPTGKEELPIAARFLRSIGAQTSSSTSLTAHPSYGSGKGSSGHPSAIRHNVQRSNTEYPSIPSPNASRASLVLTPSSSSLAPPSQSNPALPLSSSNAATSSRFPFARPRHPLRPPPAGKKLHKANAPDVVVEVPVELRECLIACGEMLRGHEELSVRLKDQWTRGFPLVRGLAGIWNDQPWFLEVYARYITNLEAAIAIIDLCLPSSLYVTPTFSSASHSRSLFSSKPSKPKVPDVEPSLKSLSRLLMTLEEDASVAGEAGIGIALLKPLMRLGKLPLLMQSLLWNTDAVGLEYEKTRAMALEVDALVRSIEDEKLDEDEREKVRDVMARIEGIKDKGLMAPRSSRVLIEEIPVLAASTSSLPRGQENANAAPPRRAVSDSHPLRSRTPNALPLPSPPRSTTKKTTRRLSDIVGVSSAAREERKEWFIRFSDVTIRVAKTGTTDVPGGFSREKEKMGKQGKKGRKGKLRNLYKFVKVEQWEMREVTSSGIVSMEDIGRSRSDVEQLLEDSEEEGEDFYDEEDDDFDTQSRMSFSYEADDPQPVAPRTFKYDPNRPPSRFSTRSTSATPNTQSKQRGRTSLTPNPAKMANRLPATSLGPNRRFDAPTAASLAKKASAGPRSSGRVSDGSTTSSAPPQATQPGAAAGSKRGLSSPAMTGAEAPSIREDKTYKFGAHGRDDSTLGMLQAFWKEESVPV